MSISKIRKILYTSAKLWGNIDAVSKEKIKQRIKNQLKGKIMGRFMR